MLSFLKAILESKTLGRICIFLFFGGVGICFWSAGTDCVSEYRDGYVHDSNEYIMVIGKIEMLKYITFREEKPRKLLALGGKKLVLGYRSPKSHSHMPYRISYEYNHQSYELAGDNFPLSESLIDLFDEYRYAKRKGIQLSIPVYISKHNPEKVLLFTGLSVRSWITLIMPFVVSLVLFCIALYHLCMGVVRLRKKTKRKGMTI